MIRNVEELTRLLTKLVLDMALSPLGDREAISTSSIERFYYQMEVKEAAQKVLAHAIWPRYMRTSRSQNAYDAVLAGILADITRIADSAPVQKRFLE
jgi:hypothetical protein